MSAALQFIECLGHISPQGAIDIVNGGVLNSTVTASDVRNAISIHGLSFAALKGKTHRKTSTAARQQIVGPRVTQVQQTLDLDIFFVKQLAFLIRVLSPLGLNLCQHIKDRSFECVQHSVRTFISIAASRDFAVKEVRVDGEGALAVMVPALQAAGIVTNTTGPGQHVPRAENMIKVIKERVRAFDSMLPYVMTSLLWCCSQLRTSICSPLPTRWTRSAHRSSSPVSNWTLQRTCVLASAREYRPLCQLRTTR